MSKINSLLIEAIEGIGELSPIQTYIDNNWIFYYGDRVELFCKCRVKQAEEAFKLHSFRVLEDWSDINQCKIQFSKKEYDEKYNDIKQIKIKEYLIALKNYYEKFDNKIDFDGTFGETIITICDILSDYHQLDNKSKEELLLLLIELIKEVKEYINSSNNTVTDKIKMEREYLAKLKENRNWYKTVVK